MKRRSFLKNTLPLMAAPLAVNGLPVRMMGRSLMTQSFTCDQINDRVLVLIQMHGGNDGLNTLVPIDQYDVYKNNRPIIGLLDNGIRQFVNVDTTLDNKDQVGLHPDMLGIRELYDEGKVNFVMDVSYDNVNGSHFRGTDIWLSGVDGKEESISPDSGWFGRYLDHRYPGFPDAYPSPAMPDPPGLEFGSHIVSLGFHRIEGIPIGLTLSNNPSSFYDQVAGVGGLLPSLIPDSDYGKALKYIIEIERSTNVYAERLAEVYEQGSNAAGVEYPEVYHTQTNNRYANRLSGQLRTIARLLSGGCKTKIFLARIGGFDTHANQAIAGKPSFGGHGALLYHLSEAIHAFMKDLKEQGLDDRVMIATFSEFGRQVAENGDWGTDHGTSGPMMVIGKGVQPGISGTNPNISNIQNNRLQGYQHDYRQVFTTILQDWLGANNGTLDHVEFYEFAGKKLDLVNSQFIDDQGQEIDFVADTSCDTTPDLPDPEISTSVEPDTKDELSLKVFPNPVRDRFTVSLSSETLKPVKLVLSDMKGKQIRQHNVNLYVGENKHKMNVSGLARGVYILQVVDRTRESKAPLFSEKVLLQ